MKLILQYLALTGILCALLLRPFHAKGEECDERCLCSTEDSAAGILLAPIGIMGDHTHHTGGWMISYRFMAMQMNGIKDGSTQVDEKKLLNTYMEVPTRMDMRMHMVDIMFAPNRSLTLMGMLPFIQYSMDHITTMGPDFTVHSSGIGDLQLSVLYSILRQNNYQFHVNLGISLPTGSIDKRDSTDMGARQKLTYDMQLGHGTPCALPGISFLAASDHLSWGGTLSGMIPLGKNTNNYAHGNQIDITAWGAYRWLTQVSSSIRVQFSSWDHIKGKDGELAIGMMPSADPNFYGGERIDCFVGSKYHFTSGFLNGNQLGFEAGIPVYQSLNGLQLQTVWQCTLGWQWSI